MKAGLGTAPGGTGSVPRFTPPSVTELAKLFPQLEVLELIGQGGMGAVYRARQPNLDRLVAIKILPPEITATPGFAERFAREARALAKLSHSNIVGIYDFGRTEGLHYFIMEYVDGLNLRQLVAAGKLAPREALQIIPQICDALQFAHDEGIVHRDIKPENVMLDKRGRVKIADFGLAKLLGREPEKVHLTGAKDVMGTPSYMAPEQMEMPNAVDHRADIYSLGVVLYEMLTGELPLGKFALPSRKVAVDVRLDQVVLHALEKEPARRYQHASQMKTDVETIAHTPEACAPSPVAAKAQEELQMEDAARQVKGPAIGLVVTGILNWITIPFIVLFMASLETRTELRTSPTILVPLAALVLSGFMFAAGLKMKRLQAYWLAVAGSVLSMLVMPGNLAGLPLGIWSLIVLSQKRVRSCFGKELPFSTSPPVAPRPARGEAWKVAAVIAAAVMLVLAIPAGVVLVSMTIPAIQRARTIARLQAIQFTPVKEVTLRGIEPGRLYQALDLDSGQVAETPARRASAGQDTELLKSNLLTWLAAQGMDLMAARGRDRWRLVTTADDELKLTPVPNEFWDRKTFEIAPVAEDVIAGTIRKDGLVEYRLAPNAQPPLTFRFETRSGAKGLLQVTALGESPDYARLRFMRVAQSK